MVGGDIVEVAEAVLGVVWYLGEKVLLFEDELKLCGWEGRGWG